MAKQVRLNHLTFTLLLEELLSGPTTVPSLVEHCGMSHRYICQLLRTMHAKKVVHVSGWEKDSIGRVGVKVFALGAGKDAPRPRKPRAEVNRDYRMREARAPMAGTHFAGLGAR